jgi:acyl carrier protein
MMNEEEARAWVERRLGLLDRVRKVLIERLNVPRAPGEIDPDAPLFGTGLGLDSVDAVELVVSLETEFSITLPEGVVTRRSMRTVGSLIDLVITREPK